MRQLLLFCALAMTSLGARADMFAIFREPDGSTKWQYVANTSAGVLIITLVIVLLFLFRAHRRAMRWNRALTDIKVNLEQRVAQRTAVLQQTTEQLQEREAYIASIVNSMPVMLIGLNQQLHITQWNKKAEEITGRPLQDVIGKNLWEAYSAITLTKEQVQAVLASGETTSLKHTQRGQYTFDITLYPLDNQNTGIVILISDVTKLVSAENKLAERDKVSAMGELASAMAYDISLPINTIFARVSSARQEIEAAELGEVKQFLLQEVETVRQSAQQATAIAHNLLDLARAHRDSKQLAEIPPIMDRAIELASDLFTDVNGITFKYINIRRNYADALPQIPCFATELEQVFVRLMRNAFYALNAKLWDEHNKPWINIEIGTFYDSLWIKLEHNGKSLTEEEQLDIFQPFFALSEHNSSFPVEQRLSYSHFIITDHHRGQMAVTSDDEHGTCFNIQLALR
ncbi:PAS domain S-box protein [Cellvibrio sp. KY-GH-1]|uniref:sensor histidine kinase n=1 Tax=Cellvibrio sp. KY-GH-1 TaxID=2303332 RepID=UPI0012465D11|nr:PAS domain S-box protein [Cellvibrio sp. KY-GH-1]QEY17152.1 PAS domain S-box protein [Cellvibrio sp. KY-GH-1]